MRKKVIPLLSCLLLLASCGEKEYLFYSGANYFVFNSYFQWHYDSNQGSFGDEIDDLVARIDNLADPYHVVNGVNNLYAINRTNEPVSVDPLLFELVSYSLEMKTKSEGYFNPLIGKITSLWKDTLFGETKPTASDIESAKAQIPALLEEMSSSSIVLNETNKTIQRVGNAYIDLGGLTKGFSVEKVEEILKEKGSTRYLLNAGQSSLGLGKNQNGGSFTVNVKYGIEGSSNRYALQDIDSSTSAIYEQSVVVDGVTYSHVINPINGLPLTDYSMAFLVSSDSILMDAFSTSCMIAGLAKTREWANRYDFKYALFVDEGGYASLVEESQSLTELRVNA